MYLILEVQEEVPNFQAGIFPEDEAKEHVRNYCEKHDIDFKGLDSFHYNPNMHIHAWLEVAPISKNPKLGFYWSVGEESDLETVSS